MEMHLDLETYCDLDLRKVGVYRYAEHPSFEILLTGYSLDGGPVDVLEGDPRDYEDFTKALEDPEVTKVAHNAGFDRVALSAYYSDSYLDPSSWRDTMAEAAVAGQPKSLDKLATSLGVSAKDSAGTYLISYFSKPYKGDRRYPEDDIERWADFKRYCKIDVEVLMDVDSKLQNLSDKEQEVWILDQKINDRGMAVDIPLAKWAEKQNTINSTEARAELQGLLGIENGNSVQQVKNGLAGIGLEVDDLRAGTVQDLLDSDELSQDQRRALELRSGISLTAAKKYTAAILMTNDDGRFRGGFSYFGAHTGRWCLTGDHEVLTPSGWQRIDEWEGGHIASWSPNEQISFQAANAVSFDYSGPMYEYDSTRIKQISTPEHKMPVVSRKTGKVESVTVEEMRYRRNYVSVRGTRKNSARAIDPNLRVLVMVQADGHFNTDGTLILRFLKDRKIQRCRELLRDVEIPFTETYSGGGTTIKIPKRVQPTWILMFQDKTFGPWLWDMNPTVFFGELVFWDGHKSAPNSYQYTTTSKTNADMVQAFAHLSGMFVRVLEKNRDVEGWKTTYILNVWLTAPQGHELREKPKEFDFTGQVYCAETQTGYFLVRRNGSVWVTGNSGRGIQLQNLPKAQLDYPNAAIADYLMGLRADAETLKALVRSVLTGPFVVSDFAGIEARVLAWISREGWALRAFEDGRDIYTETAQRMGGLTRDEGKLAVLALGYGGGVGALKAFGEADDPNKLDRFKNDWRKLNKKIVSFWYDLEEVFERGTGNAGRIHVSSQGRDRLIHLPSGRVMNYRDVRREKWRMKTEDDEFVPMEGIRFSGSNGRMATYGGRLAENVTQAIARDLLVEALLTMDRKGYDIVGHVHDEVIAESDDPEKVAEMEDIMSTPPSWAEGLPLGAEGFYTYRYRKG